MIEEVDPRVERTRQRVFAATLELLRSEGLDAVTHSRVAEVSGVGRATIYRHWPEAASLLLDTILDQHLAQRALPADPAELSLREGVLAVVRVVATMLREDPMIPSMLAMLERAEHHEEWAEVRRRVSSVMGGPLEQLIAAAQARGELPADLDVAHAKAMLAGPLFFSRMVLGAPLQDEQVPAHVDAWLRAVRATNAG